MRRLILTAMMLLSCGSEDPADWTRTTIINKRLPPVWQEKPVESLKDLLNEFLFDCGVVYGADVSDAKKLEYIRYGDPRTEAHPYSVGVCSTWRYGDDLLYKSSIIVKEMDSAISMKALVYHELGHCILNLDHTDQEFKTMMSPVLHADAYYELNWNTLVKDMCRKYK